MAYHKVRGLVMGLGVAAMLLAMPAETEACGWLDRLFGGCCGGTSCAAPCAAPAYTPPTVTYMPQTCYRTVYRAVPVTTCQPVTTCDPCTGCPMTCFRPVRSWTCQAQLVPYTTYRLVYSNPCSPCGTSVGVSAASYTSVPGCPSCTVGGSSVVPYSSRPSLPETSPLKSEPLPKTFKEEPKSSTETLKPIPDVDTKLNSMPAPKLIDPDNRTTLRPVRQAAHYRLISSPPRPASLQSVPSGGVVWRASSD